MRYFSSFVAGPAASQREDQNRVMLNLGHFKTSKLVIVRSMFEDHMPPFISSDFVLTMSSVKLVLVGRRQERDGIRYIRLWPAHAPSSNYSNDGNADPSMSWCVPPPNLATCTAATELWSAAHRDDE
ncbi:unnamed protein product [Soboliphyme baturini]|uniref:Uncharacterized protein n=1 Tax=Soboliphyme baturini TaxID=241478 RepID=A0A183IRL1_9BILA|nr:unnamed protein product [Soboliphyme baturini]